MLSLSRTRSGAGAGVFLGAVFLLVGLGVVVFSPLDTLYQHWRSADWARVPVVLDRLEVERIRGSEGGYTFRVLASYQYHYNDRYWRGSRVGYDTGSDNIGDWHQQVVSRLKRAPRVDAWVNPHNPADVFLVRELRWEKLAFGSIFGGVFALTGAAILLLPRLSKRKAGTPENVFYSDAPVAMWVWLFMGAVFTGLGSMPVLALVRELERGNYAILVVLVFPLAGALMLRQAWTAWRAFRHYGRAPLALEPFPGQLQGDVGGHIRVNESWRPSSNYSLTLQCIRMRVRGSGKNRRTDEDVLWQQDQVPLVEADGRAVSLRFLFQPPTDDVHATGGPAHDRILWRVLLSGGERDISLERSYEIPVVAGSDRAARALPTAHVERVVREARTVALEAAVQQVEVEQTSRGLRLFSSAGRNRGMSIGMTLFGLVFASISAFLFREGVTGGGIGLYFMAVVFGLFGVPMLIGGLFMLGRSLEVHIRNTEITTQRRWMGIALWRRTVRLAGVDKLVLKKAGSASQGRRTTEYFHLETAHAPHVRVAEGVQGRAAAEALRDTLSRLIR